MKIFSKSDNKVIVQLREFKRDKSGNMKNSGSRTITLHDAEIAEIYQRLTDLFERDENYEALRAQAS